MFAGSIAAIFEIESIVSGPVPFSALQLVDRHFGLSTKSHALSLLRTGHADGFRYLFCRYFRIAIGVPAMRRFPSGFSLAHFRRHQHSVLASLLIHELKRAADKTRRKGPFQYSIAAIMGLTLVVAVSLSLSKHLATGALPWPCFFATSVFVFYHLACDYATSVDRYRTIDNLKPLVPHEILEGLPAADEAGFGGVDEHFGGQRFRVVVRAHHETVRAGAFDDQNIADLGRRQFSRADETAFLLGEDIARLAKRPADDDVLQLRVTSSVSLRSPLSPLPSPAQSTSDDTLRRGSAGRDC